MTESSARLALPLLQAGQAQKEIFHNEAIVLIDAMLHPVAEALFSNTPPSAPMAGASWIVGANGTGAWAGQSGYLATWTGGGWRFVMPVAGMQVWLKDRARWIWHDGVAWVDGALPCAGVSVGNVRVVGPRQAAVAAPANGNTVDIEARTAISAILSALREHGLIAT